MICFYYLESLAVTTDHLLVLCVVRVSNKPKSWNENQMSHVVVEPGRSGTAGRCSSSSSSFLPTGAPTGGPGRGPSIPPEP